MRKDGKGSKGVQWAKAKLWKPLGWMGAGLMLGALIMGSWNIPFPSYAAGASVIQTNQMSDPPNFSRGGFADIAKKVTPAVVNITVEKTMPLPMSREPFEDMKKYFNIPGMPEFPNSSHPNPQPQGAGSGVLISGDGYILTNNHVVDKADRITVTLPDNREFSGRVIGTDPQTDLAVIKIDGQNLPFLAWGDSSKLQVGEYVLAVGNPFGLNSTVTLGIVSAIGRGGMGITQYEDFIQTDAAINPGNSGGALVNTRGELVGINTAIFSRTGGYQGVGLAVPTKLAKPVYSSLLSHGKVVRGHLGIGIQAVTPDLAKSFDLEESRGALVTNVVPGSPADESGMQRGDVVIEYDGKPVVNPRTLQGQVLGTPVGNKVAIVIVREGSRITLNPVIREQQASTKLAQAMPSEDEGPLAGVAVQDLDERTARQLGLEPHVNGVVVRGVQPRSSAARAGLIQGDVISEINKQPIRSREEFLKAVSHLHDENSALVFIHRGKGALYLTVKI